MFLDLRSLVEPNGLPRRFVSNAATGQPLDLGRAVGYGFVCAAATAILRVPALLSVTPQPPDQPLTWVVPSSLEVAESKLPGKFVTTANQPQLIDLTLPAQFQPALVSGHTPPVIGVVSNASSPQLVDLTPPSQVLPSQVSGATPAVIGTVTDANAPQSVDLTLQAKIQPSLVGPPPKPVIQQLQGGPQLVDLTLPAQVQRSLVSGQTPPVIGTVSNAGAPQLLDLTLPARIQPSQVSGSTPPTLTLAIYASPEFRDLTQQAWVSRPIPNREGPVPPLATDANQPQLIDLTLQAWITPATVPSGAVGPASYTFGSHAAQIAEYAATRLVTPAAVAPPAVTTGPVPPLTTAYPSVDLTLQAALQQPLVGTVATPKAVIPQIVAAPQSVDLTLQAVVTPATVSSGIVGAASYTFGTHAQHYAEYAATRWVSGPSSPALGAIFPYFLSSPQDADYGVPAWVTPASQTLLVTGPVIPRIVSAPQSIDLTLQAVVTPAAPPPVVVVTGPLIPTVVTPQQAYTDVLPVLLTVQPIFGLPPQVVGGHGHVWEQEEERLRRLHAKRLAEYRARKNLVFQVSQLEDEGEVQRAIQAEAIAQAVRIELELNQALERDQAQRAKALKLEHSRILDRARLAEKRRLVLEERLQVVQREELEASEAIMFFLSDWDPRRRH